MSCSSAAPRRDWLTNCTISAGSRDSNSIGLPVSYGSPYELYSGWDWIYVDTATVASPASKTFTIQNTGNADLTLDLNSLSVPAGFAVTSFFAPTVAPNESTAMTVDLDADQAGYYSGLVSFSTNDSDENPLSVLRERPGDRRQPIARDRGLGPNILPGFGRIGQCRFWPDDGRNANYLGTDTFTYKATDGEEESGVVSVTINIVNSPPAAAGAAFRVHHDQTLYASGLGLMEFFADADHDDLTIAVLSDVSHGDLVLSNDGTLAYTRRGLCLRETSTPKSTTVKST